MNKYIVRFRAKYSLLRSLFPGFDRDYTECVVDLEDFSPEEFLYYYRCKYPHLLFEIQKLFGTLDSMPETTSEKFSTDIFGWNRVPANVDWEAELKTLLKEGK